MRGRESLSRDPRRFNSARFDAQKITLAGGAQLKISRSAGIPKSASDARRSCSFRVTAPLPLGHGSAEVPVRSVLSVSYLIRVALIAAGDPTSDRAWSCPLLPSGEQLRERIPLILDPVQSSRFGIALPSTVSVNPLPILRRLRCEPCPPAAGSRPSRTIAASGCGHVDAGITRFQSRVLRISSLCPFADVKTRARRRSPQARTALFHQPAMDVLLQRIESAGRR